MKKIILGEKKASLTVEASLVLPIFLFAMILVAYMGQIIKCQEDMNWALTRIARETSAEYGASQSDIMKHSAYYVAKLNRYVKGVGLKVSFSQSHFLEKNDEIDIIARYQVAMPFSLLPISKITIQQRVHTRAFTGVEWRGKNGNTKEEMVYVTETGRVYHRQLSCTYLKLSISEVYFDDLALLRNESGGRYKRCERCAKGVMITGKKKVWITNYGEHYHVSSTCSGLKRSIRQIPLSEAGTRTPCHKCGGDNQ